MSESTFDGYWQKKEEERLAIKHANKVAGGKKAWETYLKKRGPGRPKKRNYRPGYYDPSRKSAASKAMWVKWKAEGRPVVKKLSEGGLKAIKKKAESEQIYRDQLQSLIGEGLETQAKKAYKVEINQLYDLARSVIADTGVEPLPNMPPDYYKEIINFFRPGTY